MSRPENIAELWLSMNIEIYHNEGLFVKKVFSSPRGEFSIALF